MRLYGNFQIRFGSGIDANLSYCISISPKWSEPLGLDESGEKKVNFWN